MATTKILQAIQHIREAQAANPGKLLSLEYENKDNFGIVVIAGDQMFGAEYATAYIDISNPEAIDEEASITLIATLPFDYSVADDEFLQEFVAQYEEEVDNCESDFRTEFEQRALQLRTVVDEYSGNSRPKPSL